MNLLFKNAIESIDIGVADIMVCERSRTISGLRNIHAGVLLLIKEVLRQLSPQDSDEVLIKEKILPCKDESGKIIFRGKGKKTIDTRAMQERCESLGVKINWKKIEAITTHRNNAEHYYVEPDIDIRNSLDNLCIVIHDVLVTYLKKNPSDVLKTETWQYLLSESDVYQKEKKRCDKFLDQVDWNSDFLAACVKKIQCWSCGSDLIIPENGNSFDANDMAYMPLKCSFCQKMFELHDVTDDVFHALNPNRIWKCKHDIDDSEDTIIDCPFCVDFSYNMEEEKCMFCQEKAEHECHRCGEEIPASEISDGNYCGYCQHMSEKNYDK